MTIAKGKKFQASRDLHRDALVYFNVPFTGGFQCLIKAGSILVAAKDSGEDKDTLLLVPEDRESFERQYVPEHIRSDVKYAGFAFPFEKSELGSALVPIPYEPWG